MTDLAAQPLGTPEEFHQLLVELARDYAPRRFAICEEYGDRVDGRVAAWGMAFDERAVVYGDGGDLTGRFRTADSAVRLFSRGGRQQRLVWIDQPPTPEADEPQNPTD